MDDLCHVSAGDLARRIRARDVSAREATLAALARLEAVNPAINAVVDHRPDDVLAQADAVDAALARGDDLGPLAGVPVTVKINTDQAGYATTNGIGLQRDLIAQSDSPVVANLRRAGAVLLGRTNTPAFSLRWFTSNLLHGATRNPRNASLTPGGSSGGAAAAVAAGIGHLAHGTDIAGSIRYPAYACGVHGLRPSLGRIPAFNASGPERTIGGQISAVSGPIARTIGDLRIGLAAMAAPDPRDPWWVPAPLEGPAVRSRVAVCLRPDGLAVASEIVDALRDAARHLENAGWSVEEVDTLPPLREAAELQRRLWLSDGFATLAEAAEREGDPGALALVARERGSAAAQSADTVARILVRRATIVRQWQMFLAETPVLLLPVSGELPFEDGLDLAGDAAMSRVWEAQMPQIGLPLTGVPALAITTGMVGATPVGVQIVAARFWEDLCLAAGQAIEAAGPVIGVADPARTVGAEGSY